MRSIIGLCVILSLIFAASGAKSPSPTRTPSPIPSPSALPTCGGNSKCQVFTQTQDSFVLVGGGANGGNGPCDNGFGNFTYAWTRHITGSSLPDYNAYYQWDFSSLPASTVLTEATCIIPAGCFGSSSLNGVTVEVRNVTVFNELTLIDPAPAGCPSVTVGYLQDTVTVSSQRLVIDLLDLAQWSVSNGLQSAIRLNGPMPGATFLYTCTKESGNLSQCLLKWA